ncbi:hypothetical protein LCGC14_0872430 [marine sediment metagenome]|uniref:Uncharacterized protein n=1 Tax=marine sediment metagenome TaxID=412755 RepID=A0A0F9RNY9_9ZZZZ
MDIVDTYQGYLLEFNDDEKRQIALRAGELGKPSREIVGAIFANGWSVSDKATILEALK